MVIFIDTLFYQKSQVQAVPDPGNITHWRTESQKQTLQLIEWIGLGTNSFKIANKKCYLLSFAILGICELTKKSFVHPISEHRAVARVLRTEDGLTENLVVIQWQWQFLKKINIFSWSFKIIYAYICTFVLLNCICRALKWSVMLTPYSTLAGFANLHCMQKPYQLNSNNKAGNKEENYNIVPQNNKYFT